MARSIRWWSCGWSVSIVVVTGRCMPHWPGAGWTSAGCAGRCRRCRCRGRLMGGWCWPWMSPAGCGPRPTPGLGGSCVIPTGVARTSIPGWPYSVVCALERGRSSWTAPLDARRLAPGDETVTVTAVQLREVIEPLIAAGHWRPGDLDIWIVADAGYDGPRLAYLLAGPPVQVPVRMRSDRVLRRRAPPHQPGQTGRQRRHGSEFVFGDPATWGEPDIATHTDTRKYGPVTARAWNRLHPRLTHLTAWIAHTGNLPILEGTLIRLQVERLPSGAIPKPVWLWHSHTDLGPGEVDLLWQAFLRRFDIEHTFRLLKQTLGWVCPKIRTPQAADRWTWLILAAYTQLRLARPLAADLRRPWEAPTTQHRLTPARVRRGFRHLRPQQTSPPGAA